MADDFTRRQVVRNAGLLAGLPILVRLGAGCARRISTTRSVEVAAPIDGTLRIPQASAPELGRAGGAVVAHAAGQSVLVVRTGAGFAAMQAICPHAGCELAWVPEDVQAECPCHGSRFAGDGTVLNPPARGDLATWPAAAGPDGDVVVHLFAGDGTFKDPVVNGKFSFRVADFPVLQNPGGVLSGRPDGFPTPLVVTRLTGGTDANAIAALSSICTHLGCTVLPGRCTGLACGPFGTQLQCPCHGSTYTLDGTVTAEPATANLDRYLVEFDGATVTVSTTLHP